MADRVAATIGSTRLYEAERRSRLAAEHARSHLAFIAEAKHRALCLPADSGNRQQ